MTVSTGGGGRGTSLRGHRASASTIHRITPMGQTVNVTHVSANPGHSSVSSTIAPATTEDIPVAAPAARLTALREKEPLTGKD